MYARLGRPNQGNGLCAADLHGEQGTRCAAPVTGPACGTLTPSEAEQESEKQSPSRPVRHQLPAGHMRLISYEEQSAHTALAPSRAGPEGSAHTSRGTRGNH